MEKHARRARGHASQKTKGRGPCRWSIIAANAARNAPGRKLPLLRGKAPQNREQLSFGIIRNPVTDWFSWNDVLRVALPAWLVALAAVLAAEASATGAAGVTALLRRASCG